MESILHFEHMMRTPQLKVCILCREYRLPSDDSYVGDTDKNTDSSLKDFIPDSTKLILCSECKQKGHLNKKGKDYYKDSCLLPIWFEQNVNGSFKLDTNQVSLE